MYLYYFHRVIGLFGIELSFQNQESEVSTEKREMLTPLLRESLTKQGYKLIGSHSGVKLCRWTKVINKRVVK